MEYSQLFEILSNYCVKTYNSKYYVTMNRAYFYKEEFLKILSNKDADSAKEAMFKWIKKCDNTMRNLYWYY